MTPEQAIANKERVQKEAEESWWPTKRSCLELATGSGKTKIALSAMDRVRKERPELKTLIIVPTEEMRDIDWPEEAEKWQIPLNGVKIVCYATLPKEDLTAYDMLIYDEVHRVTLPNLNILDQTLEFSGKEIFVLGITATKPKSAYSAEDQERLGMLNYLFPTTYKVTTDEAVELGLIADFHVHVLLYHLDSTQNNIRAGSLKKPFMTNEAAHYKYLTKQLQLATLQAQKNPSKEGWKFSAISKRVQFMNNLPTKLKLAKYCMERLQGRTVVFASSIEQANTLCGENVYHSKSNRDALSRFQLGEIDTIATVKALNEGKNLYKPDNGLIVQVDSVERNLVQRIGRLVRIRYDNLDFKATIAILVAKGTADEQWYEHAIADFDSKRITKTLIKLP